MQEYIGSNVKLLRNENRMTIEDLAEATGLSQERIIEIEKGDTKVYLKELMALCPVLHISEEDIEERNLVEERQQAESKLKSSKVRVDYNWYYGDQKRLLRYILNLVLVPVAFVVVYYITSIRFSYIYMQYSEEEKQLIMSTLRTYQFLIPYAASAVVSLVFMIIEVFKRFKVRLNWWYLWFAGIIFSLVIFIALVMVIPFYGYCFYQAVFKKGKNR